jgi:hypothetical protein
VRTPNDFSSRLTQTIRPWPLNFWRRKHREKQNGSYRIDFDIRVDSCSCRYIKRLGHIPVDTLFWVDFSFLQAKPAM